MNIWIFNHYSSIMYFDKAGRHYWFAKELKSLGHNVTVFGASTLLNSIDRVDTGRKKWLFKNDNEVPFVFVKCPECHGNGIERIKNMFSFYVNLFSTSKWFKSETSKPDLIIASSVHPLTLVAGIQIAKKYKIPCICEIRDLWPEAIFSFGKLKQDGLLGKILIKGEHWIYKNADELIFTKEGDIDYLYEKKWVNSQGGNIDISKCHYINNGVDLDDFYYKALNETVNFKEFDNKFKVVYCGTIRPVNNLDFLIDAAKIVLINNKYSNIEFIIYGEGSDLPRLQKRVRDENISNVKLMGYVQRKFIPNILSNSSVNILNYSQSEYNWTRGNSSNKLFEYLASGKPIISSVRMGYSIINKYKCGIEIEEDTPESLANNIIKFYEMTDEQYEAFSKNALMAAKDFDIKVLAKKLNDIIINTKK